MRCLSPAAVVALCAWLWVSHPGQGLEAQARPGLTVKVSGVTCLHGGDTALSTAVVGFGCFLAPKKVCQEFLNRFYNSLIAREVSFSLDVIEKELVAFCLDAKGKENRLCYYLGATKDAATKILSEVTRPMSVHMPAGKICEKLKKMDSQICELKYEKKFDLASVDLGKMRVAELKQILLKWGAECRACAEKSDYVNLIKELAPNYAAIHPQTEL